MLFYNRNKMLGAGENAQLFLQRPGFSSSTYMMDCLQLFVIPVSGASGTLFWPLRALHAHGAQIYRQQNSQA